MLVGVDDVRQAIVLWHVQPLLSSWALGVTGPLGPPGRIPFLLRQSVRPEREEGYILSKVC